jgi:NtrC-family two-component system sensor histidine kinase KinB
VNLGPTDYQKTLYPRFAAVREDCMDLRRLNEQAMYTASLGANVVANRAIWSTALVAAAALILALVFSWFLAERVAQPVRRFMEASRKISSGDYTVEVPVETTDELGHLAGEINHMARQLGRYHEMNIDQIIAERNKSEAVLASIEDGLVIFDTSLKVAGINAAARRMLGSEVSEVSSPQFSEILPSGQLCDLIHRTVETGASPEVPDEQRVVVIPKAEGPVHLLCSITAIRGRDRVLSGVVLLLRDVTRLQEVERLKSEFVMAASHELRTPLTSLGLSVDLLLEHAADNLPERDRDLLRAAQEEVQRMKALVSDLLDLSKIEAGKISLEFQSVPVSTLVDNVEKIFASQLDMHGVVLTTELSGEIPDVRADATKVTWVLTNLVSNALRYVSRGGHISLLARRVGSHVHLSVRDDGPGIHPDDQARIFEKFVQVKGHEGGGSGLGLAICREIVRAHGGLIWVDSALGQGSTFTFTLAVTH